MQIYLTTQPEQEAEAALYGYPLARCAYHIAEGSVLLRRNLLLHNRGGILAITDRNAPVIHDPSALCAAVLRECGRWSYSGVLLEFCQPLTPDRSAFIVQLGAALTASHRTLYLPEYCAALDRQALLLISTDLSGGSLSERFQEAANQYGGMERLAMEVLPVQMDFTLPAMSGEGTALGDDMLQALIQKETPAIFYSQELFARYFTFRRDGRLHFVLYDDAQTLQQKLHLARELRLSAAFLPWTQIRPFAETLFAK